MIAVCIQQRSWFLQAKKKWWSHGGKHSSECDKPKCFCSFSLRHSRVFKREKVDKNAHLCILGLPFNFTGILFITIRSEQHYDCIVQHPRFVALFGSARGVFWVQKGHKIQGFVKVPLILYNGSRAVHSAVWQSFISYVWHNSMALDQNILSLINQWKTRMLAAWSGI